MKKLIAKIRKWLKGKATPQYLAGKK